MSSFSLTTLWTGRPYWTTGTSGSNYRLLICRTADNNNENKASDYVGAMNSASGDFKPFFVLNIYNPEYIDPQDVEADCSFDTQSITIRNSITQQLNFIL